MKLKPIATVLQVPATQDKCLEIELKLSFDYLFLHKIQLASIWWQSVAIVAMVARGGQVALDWLIDIVSKDTSNAAIETRLNPHSERICQDVMVTE